MLRKGGVLDTGGVNVCEEFGRLGCHFGSRLKAPRSPRLVQSIACHDITTLISSVASYFSASRLARTNIAITRRWSTEKHEHSCSRSAAAAARTLHEAAAAAFVAAAAA